MLSLFNFVLQKKPGTPFEVDGCSTWVPASDTDPDKVVGFSGEEKET